MINPTLEFVIIYIIIIIGIVYFIDKKKLFIWIKNHYPHNNLILELVGKDLLISKILDDTYYDVNIMKTHTMNNRILRYMENNNLKIVYDASAQNAYIEYDTKYKVSSTTEFKIFSSRRIDNFITESFTVENTQRFTLFSNDPKHTYRLRVGIRDISETCQFITDNGIEI